MLNPQPGEFPPEWIGTLQGRVPFYLHLPSDQQPVLRRLIQLFVEQKPFVGTQGMEITKEMMVLVAAYACLLILGLPELGVYPHTTDIIIYPSSFEENFEAIGPDGRRFRARPELAGQHRPRGPIVLAWDSVRYSVANPHDGYNVLLHEFAHALDRRATAYEGILPFLTRAPTADWIAVMRREFNVLVAAVKSAKPTLIRAYGATNTTEFFAVVTEHFFEQPQELKSRHPELYDQMHAFYKQDPAAWAA